MDALINFLENFVRLENTGFKMVLDTDEIVEEIIRLNTEEQLFKKGIDSKGNKIVPEYSNRTKELKKLDNQPIDRVTLKDTGEFYESWRVYVENDSIVIDADPIKTDENGVDSNLFTKYGMDILGLTEDSIDKLKPLIIESVNNVIKRSITRG
jgi:hypothetical protein